MADNSIPSAALICATGFPGSGKTTFLLKLVPMLQEIGFQDIHYLNCWRGDEGIDNELASLACKVISLESNKTVACQTSRTAESHADQNRDASSGDTNRSCHLPPDSVTESAVNGVPQAAGPTQVILCECRLPGPVIPLRARLNQTGYNLGRNLDIVLLDAERYKTIETLTSRPVLETLATLSPCFALNKIDRISEKEAAVIRHRISSTNPRANCMPLSARHLSASYASLKELLRGLVSPEKSGPLNKKKMVPEACEWNQALPATSVAQLTTPPEIVNQPECITAALLEMRSELKNIPGAQIAHIKLFMVSQSSTSQFSLYSITGFTGRIKPFPQMIANDCCQHMALCASVYGVRQETLQELVKETLSKAAGR